MSMMASCEACKNGHMPSADKHACFFCEKAVHLLEGCSISLGFGEGHGELRGCRTCTPNGKKILIIILILLKFFSHQSYISYNPYNKI